MNTQISLPGNSTLSISLNEKGWILSISAAAENKMPKLASAEPNAVASAAAPYGYKTDGTPKKKPGRPLKKVRK